MKNLTLQSLLILLMFSFANLLIYAQGNWIDGYFWQYRCTNLCGFNAPDYDFVFTTNNIYANTIPGWESSADILKLVSVLNIRGGCLDLSRTPAPIIMIAQQGEGGWIYSSKTSIHAWPIYDHGDCGIEGCAYEYYSAHYIWKTNLYLVQGTEETLLDARVFTGRIANCDALYQDYFCPECKGIKFGSCVGKLSCGDVEKSSSDISGKLMEYSLKQNYPNPFNPTTKITYSINKDGIVKLGVFDILGIEIQTLINEFQSAGEYTVSFSVGDLPSGIYFYRIQSGSFIEFKKMILLK